MENYYAMTASVFIDLTEILSLVHFELSIKIFMSNMPNKMSMNP